MNTKMKTLLPEAVQAKLEAGAAITIIDVREIDEVEAGHIPGSINIPLGLLEFRMNELDKNTPYIMVCRSGGRSGQATAFLQYSKIISKRYRLSTQHIVKTAFFH